MGPPSFSLEALNQDLTVINKGLYSALSLNSCILTTKSLVVYPCGRTHDPSVFCATFQAWDYKTIGVNVLKPTKSLLDNKTKVQ